MSSPQGLSVDLYSNQWVITDQANQGTKYTVQNARYATYAGSTYSPEPNDSVECSDISYRTYVWRIEEYSSGEYLYVAGINK